MGNTTVTEEHSLVGDEHFRDRCKHLRSLHDEGVMVRLLLRCEGRRSGRSVRSTLRLRLRGIPPGGGVALFKATFLLAINSLRGTHISRRYAPPTSNFDQELVGISIILLASPAPLIRSCIPQGVR